ncbi:MAG: hypothetical protein HOW73_30150 [Polyangiaceae bacterium]|nr:hypothetical protein [Polyangiaceae bacterium]
MTAAGRATARDQVLALAPIAAASLASGSLLLVAPHLPIHAVAAQDLLAVILGAGGALAALHASSAGALRSAAAWISLGVAVSALVFLYVATPGAGALPVQVAALLVCGRIVGGSIGERVQHAGHVLPATVVAAAADCASLLSPEGISHGISQSDRALAVFALAAPIPGSSAITFVLGIGDLIVIALLLGVARKFGISARRVTIACVVALVAAFGASALFAAPIPALVPIAIFANALVPPFRAVAKKDRTTTIVAVTVAVGLVVFVWLRR